jgi:type I restriction enzyme S subunit
LYDDFALLPIPIPTVSDQQRIADYLEVKCGEIDSLIRLQEQMIEKLKSYKQSVITEAVTKGLNPNVKLILSGIDWIGDIPEGWEVNKLFNLCTIKGRVGWKGLRSDEFKENSYAYLVTGQDFVSSDINWKNCYQIDKERYEEDPYIQLSNGDILVTKDGTIGKIAKVSGMDKPACLNSGIFVLKQRKKTFFQNYLYWYLSSPLLLRYNTFINTGGTTIIHLYQNVFERFSMIIPPMQEQIAIATYLDKKCSEIDNLIALKQQKIEKLMDYKKSVIYEAVTGKINIDSKKR